MLRSITRADWVIEVEIRNRLGVVGGAHRWQVAVSGGKVSVVDRGNSATERHVAEVLIRWIAGVTDVELTTERVLAGS